VAAALESWVREGWLRELDRSFAAFVAEQSAQALQAPMSEPLKLAAALVSHQLGRGHPRLDLAAALADPEGVLALPPTDDDARAAAATGMAPPPAPGEVLGALGLDAAGWAAALADSPAVGAGAGTTPLVLTGTRLALRRYWQHEQTVAQAIDARLPAAPPSPVPPPGVPATTAPPAPPATLPASPAAEAVPALLPDLDAAPGRAALRAALDVLFPPLPAGAAPGPDWQKIACAVAARSHFAIVTGGPGTGKTTTVVRLLALLQHLALRHGARALRVRMAAPTGKAAARLNAAVAQAVQRLPLERLVAVQTLDDRPAGAGAGAPAHAIAGAGGDQAHDPVGALREAIPTAVVTLHRLLGVRPDTRRLAHDARQPLPLDLLVIDEASMVDLELMARTCAALRPGARLVLLGDKDQLASVEAGAVLGGLCARADAGHHRPALADWLHEVTGERVPAALVDPDGRPLDQAVVALRHSHRFDAAGGIGRLAAAVNQGDVAGVRNLLAAAPPGLARVVLPRRVRGAAPSAGRAAEPRAERDAGSHPGTVGSADPGTGADAGALRRLLLDGACDALAGARRDRVDGARELTPPVGYRHYLQQMRERRPAPGSAQSTLDAWGLAVLQAFGAFQLLCALRRGEFGVEAMNARVAALLLREGLIPAAEGWYAGRPVMVTRNDHALGLMNGDVGIALAVPGPAQVLRVAFPAGDGGGVRWIAPSRLQAVETAYAMTVHKSQGSEFAHAALLLPDHPAPVLTRELLYTAVTRASHWFTLALPAGAEDVLESAVAWRTGGAPG
jgi:exodeoxyribonuclease V alpha subunit